MAADASRALPGPVQMDSSARRTLQVQPANPRAKAVLAPRDSAASPCGEKVPFVQRSTARIVIPSLVARARSVRKVSFLSQRMRCGWDACNAVICKVQRLVLRELSASCMVAPEPARLISRLPAERVTSARAISDCQRFVEWILRVAQLIDETRSNPGAFIGVLG